jgi:hypothetical protein
MKGPEMKTTKKKKKGEKREIEIYSTYIIMATQKSYDIGFILVN